MLQETNSSVDLTPDLRDMEESPPAAVAKAAGGVDDGVWGFVGLRHIVELILTIYSTTPESLRFSVDMSDNTSGIAGYNHPRRHIAGHDGTGSHHRAAADCHSRQYRGPGSYPHAVAYSHPSAHCTPRSRSSASSGWQAVRMLTLGPMNTLLPISTRPSSSTVRLKLTYTLSPTCILHP